MINTAGARPRRVLSPTHLCRQLLGPWLYFAVVMGAMLGGSTAYPQESANAPEPRVIVWRRLRNDFHNAAISPEFVAQVVERTPPTLLALGQGETISSKLKENFNISVTWTPQIYQRMLGRIAELNSLPDVNKVAAGTTLLIPQVPRVGKKYKQAPLAWTGQIVKTSLSWARDAATDTEESEVVPDGAAPQQEVQYFAVPLSEVSKYLLPSHVEQGASGPMQVSLSQGGIGTVVNPVMSDATATLVRSKLGAAIDGPKPLVIIVDDSVPDSTEYAIAKSFVVELSKTIRTVYKLGASPFISEAEALPDSLASENSGTLFPNLKTHASLIKQSLLEFTSLDTSKKVAVIYIPLGATQVEVAPLLKEIVYLGQLLKIVHPSLPPLVTASQPQRDQARDVTEAIVNGNQGTFKFGLLMPVGAGELTVTTDSMLLESLGISLSYYADAASRPYWLSFSWTTTKLTFPTYFAANTYGLKVAAAGNQKDHAASTSFLQLELEYASRAATSQDFVVVMNSTGSGSGCPSNLFDDSEVSVATVAFPGNATDKFCGTSFSTPRVAWLLAAKEAALGQPLTTPLAQKLSWLQRQHAAILALRKSTMADIFNRYSLDVQKLFLN